MKFYGKSRITETVSNFKCPICKRFVLSGGPSDCPLCDKEDKFEEITYEDLIGLITELFYRDLCE